MDHRMYLFVFDYNFSSQMYLCKICGSQKWMEVESKLSFEFCLDAYKFDVLHNPYNKVHVWGESVFL